MPYFVEGQEVRDTLLEREGGTVKALRPGVSVRIIGPDSRVLRADREYLDVEWPDGTVATYGRQVAAERLEVTKEGLFDLFRLGVDW